MITLLAMCTLAGIALVSSYPTIAGIICSTTVVAVAAVFVTGRHPVETDKKKTGNDLTTFQVTGHRCREIAVRNM